MSEHILRKTSDAPWRVHETSKVSVIDNEGHLVASCSTIRPIHEEKANAKLISLAPDLADALKDLVSDVESKNNGDYSGNIRVSFAVSILKQIGAYEDLYEEDES